MAQGIEVADRLALSQAQIQRVWEGMLGAEIRSNYFAELVLRFNTEQKLLTWLTLFLSSGALVTILASIPANYSWIRPILAALAAGTSLYSVVRQNQKSAVDATNLHAKWLRLASRYTELWENLYRQDAEDKLRELTTLAEDASVAGNVLPNDEARMLKWENYVLAHHGLPVTA